MEEEVLDEEEIKKEENPYDPLESIKYIGEELKKRKKLHKIKET
jgi:hypothetical protein